MINSATMQIGSTIPAQSLPLLQTRLAGFKRRGSPLNPLSKPSIDPQILNTTTDQTKTHLSNLEKLLHKHSHSSPPEQLSCFPESDKGLCEDKEKGGILEGLNLARLWPAMKTPEEMSPRNLNRLQRLLSKSEEYSPRNNIGGRWRRYHGSDDWAGLLDPLDENLRREVVRYGEFVQAAYHSFHSNPSTSDKHAPGPRYVALPDRSYKVTKSLYATSSVGLPKWVDEMAPDLGWMTQRSSWIGYVAVCDDPREIQRMGRRDIVISLRGTATCLEWTENVRDLLVQIPGENDSINGQPKVECGFLSLYKTSGAHISSLSETVVTEVKRLIEKYKDEPISISVTGHSLGAALALLVGDELSTCAPNVPPIAVFSFGGPRVGNRSFANRLNSNNVKVLRIVNNQDVITKVPGIFVSEELDQKLRESGAGSVLNAMDNSMPWAYSHVGVELRVDTKMSPYLKPNADAACCHDLEAYLHLVDGFLASNCPFRSNAKRSLVKLLNEQGSNVKRLYTSKVSSLSLNLERGHRSLPSCLPSPS